MKKLITITTLICLSLGVFAFTAQAEHMNTSQGDLIPIEEYIKMYSENDPKVIKISEHEYILDKSITNTDFTRLEVSPGSRIYFLKKDANQLAGHECPDDYTISEKDDDVYVDGRWYDVQVSSGIGFFWGWPTSAQWCGMGRNYIIDEPSDDYINHLRVKSYAYGVGLDFSFDEDLSIGFTLIASSTIEYDREKENIRDHSARYHDAYVAGILTSCGTSTRAGLDYKGDYDYVENYINWYTD